jgi:hypothetical protein
LELVVLFLELSDAGREVADLRLIVLMVGLRLLTPLPSDRRGNHCHYNRANQVT